MDALLFITFFLLFTGIAMISYGKHQRYNNEMKNTLEEMAQENRDFIKKVNQIKREKRFNMDDNLPTVVSEGIVNILGRKLKVYVLDNGARVFEKDDIESFFNELGEKQE